MSKNFELLQELGGDEELFRTSGLASDTITALDVEANPEVDEAERNRVLQKATLPSPLEIIEKGGGGLSSSLAGESVGPGEARDPLGRRPGPARVELRAPLCVTTPLGVADLLPLRPPERMNGDIRESAPSGAKSTTIQSPVPSVMRENPETFPVVEDTPEERIEWGQIDWTLTLKALITPRKARIQARRKYPGADLNVIAREEELKLVQRIFPANGQNTPQVVLFSNLDHESENPSICTRIAEILTSRGDGPVCVVDGNFHSPSLHRHFCVENLKGLADAALETEGIENFVQQIGESNLWLIPAGSSVTRLSPSAITEALRKRITELRYAFKYVVIQAGALSLETSEMLMSRWADGVVLVVEANSTPRELAKRVKDNLQTARVKLLGVVLNNRTFPIPESIYRSL
jgi:hypothetical protein